MCADADGDRAVGEPSAVRTSRRVPVRRLAMVMAWAWLLLAASGLMNGCQSVDERTNDDLITNQELTTENRVQNIVSLPFRIVGGMIIYPLKLIFYDIPRAIGQAFSGGGSGPVHRLASEDPKEREFALAELGEIGDVRNATHVERLLDDPEAAVRRQALLTLAKLGDESYQARISSFAYDPDTIVRAAAVLALGELNAVASLPLVRAKFIDEEESEIVRSYALVALARLGDAEAEAHALALLEDDDVHTLWHANALLALGHLATPAGVQVLDQAIDAANVEGSAQDERVTIAAITALGIAGRFGRLLALANAPHSQPMIRHKALLTLGEYGGQSYVDILERFTQHEDKTTQIHALFGIAMAGDPRACAGLIQLMHDPDPWVRLWSLTFLRRLADEDFGIEPDPWASWWQRFGPQLLREHQRQQQLTGS